MTCNVCSLLNFQFAYTKNNRSKHSRTMCVFDRHVFVLCVHCNHTRMFIHTCWQTCVSCACTHVSRVCACNVIQTCVIVLSNINFETCVCYAFDDTFGWCVRMNSKLCNKNYMYAWQFNYTFIYACCEQALHMCCVYDIHCHICVMYMYVCIHTLCIYICMLWCVYVYVCICVSYMTMNVTTIVITNVLYVMCMCVCVMRMIVMWQCTSWYECQRIFCDK